MTITATPIITEKQRLGELKKLTGLNLKLGSTRKLHSSANKLCIKLNVLITYSVLSGLILFELLPGQKKEFSSWEHNLETKISCRLTEYFCAKSACA
jgi:hypothetical protein